MTSPRLKAHRALLLLEEAVLDLLRKTYPDAMRATERRDELGIEDPVRGRYTNALTDSLIKRLAERGLFEQMKERGPWRLLVK